MEPTNAPIDNPVNAPAANAWTPQPSYPLTTALLPDSPAPGYLPPNYPPPARSTFWFGPAGLRAGWSLCLYFLIILAVGICLGIVVGVGYLILHPYLLGGHLPASHHRGMSRPKAGEQAWYEISLFEGLGIVAILVATWIMSLIERRPFREYGLGGSPRRWTQLLAGMFWGFATFALLIGILYLTGAIVFDGIRLSGAAIGGYALAWLLGFGAVGFFEEILFRGYLQYTLARGIGHRGWGFWISAFLLSFGFGLTHKDNPGESPVGLFSAGLIGFVFCLSLWYTRSLWWAIGYHVIWDWSSSYFWGTADSGQLVQGHLLRTHPHGSVLLSGGATGPEGSLFVLPICLLTALIIHLTLRQERAKTQGQDLINPEPVEKVVGPCGIDSVGNVGDYCDQTNCFTDAPRGARRPLPFPCPARRCG